jgi:peptide/nickel transport system substrate-binding protein
MAKRWRVVAVVAALGMVAAACGGGSKKSNAGGTNADTATTAEATTSTTALTGDTTPTTAAAGTATTVAGGSTATTAKKTTGTTAKKSTVTAAPSKSVTNVAGGITNVTQPATTAPPADFQPGGTITYAKTADVASLDPVKITNSGASDGFLADAIYDMLLYTDAKTGSIVPQTAESLTSSDGQVWTLKLRPNIKFSDGTAYDAAAVKFNYLRLQDPANAANRAAQAKLIDTMDVIDPLTLKMTLKNKNAVFPVAVTLIPFIASPAAIQAQGSKYGGDASVVGAGPFLLKNWVRDSQYNFVRNAGYWRQPQPYVDQVVVKPIVDETQRMNTFTSGQANLVFLGTGSNADQVQKSGSGVMQTMILNGGINWYFNTKAKPFNDVRARQAIAMSIDPIEYSKVVNGNLQEPIDSIFRHDSPFFDPTITQPKYDPVKAQQLFDQLAAANGGPLSFTVTAFPVTNYQNSVQYIQGVLNNKYKNVHMEIVTEASAKHITDCTAGNFAQVCQFGNIFDDPEPGWTGLYTCNAVPSPTGWCNAQFDKDVLDNQQTLNSQQRINDIKDAQKQFYAEVPSWYQERRYSWMFSAPNVQNFRYADDGMVLLGELWIKSK